MTTARRGLSQTTDSTDFSLAPIVLSISVFLGVVYNVTFPFLLRSLRQIKLAVSSGVTNGGWERQLPPGEEVCADGASCVLFAHQPYVNIAHRVQHFYSATLCQHGVCATHLSVSTRGRCAEVPCDARPGVARFLCTATQRRAVPLQVIERYGHSLPLTYPCDAILARVLAITLCVSVCLSVCLSVASRCPVEAAGHIELVFGRVYFDLSYTVL